MGARFYSDFHVRMHALTENLCSDEAATDATSSARRCYLVDTAGYAIWAPQFAALDIYDTRSFQSVPLARFEGRVFHELEKLGVFTRYTEILRASAPRIAARRGLSDAASDASVPRYQGVCQKTPGYDMDAVTEEGAFPPAEAVDAHYPGSDSLGYFPPWANTYGCVQDVVYYDLEEDQVSGVVTGEVAGSCYKHAAFSFARAPGTNAYLLVIDDIDIAVSPEPEASDGFDFSCSVENGARRRPRGGSMSSDEVAARGRSRVSRHASRRPLHARRLRAHQRLLRPAARGPRISRHVPRADGLRAGRDVQEERRREDAAGAPRPLPCRRVPRRPRLAVSGVWRSSEAYE